MCDLVSAPVGGGRATMDGGLRRSQRHHQPAQRGLVGDHQLIVMLAQRRHADRPHSCSDCRSTYLVRILSICMYCTFNYVNILVIIDLFQHCAVPLDG
jgi:hypothetical protein